MNSQDTLRQRTLSTLKTRRLGRRTLAVVTVCAGVAALSLAAMPSFAQSGMPPVNGVVPTTPNPPPPPTAGPDYGDAADQNAALGLYLQRSFDAIDTNHDGKIDRNEWAAYQRSQLQARRATFERYFKAADKDGDGYLSRDEAAASEPFLYQHFDEIDVNRDGKLSAAEIRSFFRRYYHDRAQADAATTKP
ncbi:EF-hand domain-containing protein [Pandoraea commovens]|uniref:Calcium-binding EF-hand n=1 Tax=Pandoraea commovens TaxID=2508289 RepID=A0A5E4Y9Z3_9BURK|nr:EF-hand domain-containing protein [Pandoraea commovens]UVA78116.1 EF-hand domain-containing protein [Pandoraea commovens]VVE45506.1 calcium-binding EF-hand [Pandoraea commovens]